MAAVCGPAGRPIDAPLESVLGEDPELCDLLRARRLERVGDLLYLAPWELRDWMLVDEDEAMAVVARAWAACSAAACSAWDLGLAAAPLAAPLASVSSASASSSSTSTAAPVTGTACNRLPTPLRSLNQALDGGLSGAFVEVAGPPGSGKSQFCLHCAALVAAAGGEVFWLDTERTFSPPRVLELLEVVCRTKALPGVGAGEVETLALAALPRIRRRLCESIQELDSIVAELRMRAQCGEGLPALVVVDSVASVARNEGNPLEGRGSHIPKRQAALSALASLFKVLVGRAPGRRGPAPGVLVTNQVAGDPVGSGSRVTLGHVWHHAVNWRLLLSHLPPGDGRGFGTKERAVGNHRFLHVEKSPCSPPIAVQFAITQQGLEEVGVSGEQEQVNLQG